MARLLENLKAAGIVFELTSFTGGTADNAIPTGAAAVVVTDAAGAEKISEAAAALQAELEAAYAGIEEGITVRVSDAEMPEQVVSETDRDLALRYVLGIPNGVNTMSEYVDGLAESSSNLGVVRLDAESFTAVSNIRSSSSERLDELVTKETELAAACGFASEMTKSADPWPYNPDNKLLPLVREVYESLNGEPLEEVSVHAGLECGTFAILNPALNMISIGPDLTDVHTTAETLYMNSIPKIWRLLEGILQALPKAE